MDNMPMDRQPLLDALLSLAGLLSPLVESWTGDDAVSQQLRAYAEEHHCAINIAASELGIAMPVATAAAGLVGQLHTWFEGGSQSAIHLHDWLELNDVDGPAAQVELLTHAANAAEALAHWHLDHAFSLEELHHDAARALRAASRVSEAEGHPAAARDALCAAARLLEPYADGLALAVWDDACRVARRVGDPAELCEAESRRAVHVVQLATQGKASWKSASRAVERALRHLPDGAEGIEASVRLLWPLLSGHQQLRPMAIWLQFRVRHDKPDLEKALEGMERFLPLRYEGSLNELFTRLPQLGMLVGLIEDENSALEPKLEEHTVQADWVSWSFRHTAYRRAVISGESLLRERELDQILLVMNHELTHLYSMGSGVGSAVSALWATMLEREIDLYSVAELDTRSNLERFDQDADELGQLALPSLANLQRNAVSLAKVEQVLELDLKLAAVKDIWEPWFEGIAIFAETASDPVDDPIAHAGPVPVIMNLVDRAAPEQARDVEQAQAHALKVMAEAEALYGRARQAVGRQRLLAYCVTYRTLYLAGVLAVRAVVAAWRMRIGRPISGAQCARILLDYTRSATHDAIPDLALPLDQFRQALLEQMDRFYVDASSISAQDLELALENPERLRREGRDLTWSSGRAQVVADPLQQREAIAKERIISATLRAQASLAGKNADLQRVPDADAACRTVMGAAARLLADAKPHTKLIQAQIESCIRLLNVLILGEVEAPFWLVPKCGGVLVVFRTTESRRDTGDSSYNGELLLMGREKFAELEQQVLRRGDARMHVYRVADLVPGGYVDARGRGRNFTVLRYGQWLHVQPKGLFANSQDVDPTFIDDVRERVMDRPLVRFSQHIVSHGEPGAVRTLEWLSTTPKWSVDGDEVDLGPWASRVRSLCEQVLNPERRLERRAASLRLLERVFGDAELAQRIELIGIDALRMVAGAKPTDGLRLLHESARLPVDHPEAGPTAKAWRLFEQRSWGWDMVAPAATSASTPQ